mmetsp:Transcript_45740/g.135436  ORF Transcript_45740/g.135436 Transcript_45740/m.135436 type:complete len:176 (-) Transcript_45740:101-628(-)
MSGSLLPSQVPKPSALPGLGIATVQFGLSFVAAFFTGKEGGLEYAAAADLKLVLLALAAYIFVLYALIFRQGLGKNVLNPKLVTSEDPVCQRHFKNLNRSVENTLEQAPIFLAALFPYAGLVNPVLAGKLVLAYLAFLIPYPMWFPSDRMLVSTMPRYFIIKYMVASVVIAALRT